MNIQSDLAFFQYIDFFENAKSTRRNVLLTKAEGICLSFLVVVAFSSHPSKLPRLRRLRKICFSASFNTKNGRNSWRFKSDANFPKYFLLVSLGDEQKVMILGKRLIKATN